MMGVRLDKWLWAVRVFKTRAEATAACRNGRVQVNGACAKASHTVDEGDKVSVRKPPVLYTFLVEKAIAQRVGASKLDGIMKNVTPADQLDLLAARTSCAGVRARGAGRPTKKERREIDGFLMDAGAEADDCGFPSGAGNGEGGDPYENWDGGIGGES